MYPLLEVWLKDCLGRRVKLSTLDNRKTIILICDIMKSYHLPLDGHQSKNWTDICELLETFGIVVHQKVVKGLKDGDRNCFMTVLIQIYTKLRNKDRSTYGEIFSGTTKKSNGSRFKISPGNTSQIERLYCDSNVKLLKPKLRENEVSTKGTEIPTSSQKSSNVRIQQSINLTNSTQINIKDQIKTIKNERIQSQLATSLTIEHLIEKVVDDNRKKTDMKELKTVEEMLKEMTPHERAINGKFRKIKKLVELENEHIELQMRLKEEKEIDHQYRLKIKKIENLEESFRMAIQQKYNILSDDYQLKKDRMEKAKLNTVNGIFDVCLDLTFHLITQKERSQIGVIPEDIFQEWIGLAIARRDLYDLTTSLPLSRLVSYDDDILIIENSIDDYLFRLGSWKMISTVEVEPSLTENANILKKIDERVNEPPFFQIPNFNHIHVRSILITNMEQRSIRNEFLRSLKTLLRSQNVQVIEIENVVTRMLDMYKRESDGRYEEVNDIQDDDGECEESIFEEEIFLKKINRQTQTPTKIPIVVRLSNLARLGKEVGRIIRECDGNISEEFLAKMYVEYLSSLTDLNGFVLVDFPRTPKEIRALEKAFTGIDPDYVDPDREIQIHSVFSRIVPIQLTNLTQNFTSFFNVYIHMKDIHRRLAGLYLDEINIEELNAVRGFYERERIYNSVKYNVVSVEMVKYVSRLIMGDIQEDRHTSKIVFGFNTSEVEATINRITTDDTLYGRVDEKKWDKGVSVLCNRNEFVEFNEFQLKTTERQSDAVVQTTFSETDMEIIKREVIDSKIETVAEIVTPKISKEIAYQLYNTWKVMEQKYLDCLRLNLPIRKQHSKEVPFYQRKLMEYFNNLIASLNDDIFVIRKYQQKFNEFDSVRRLDQDGKLLLHIQVQKLKKKLKSSCYMIWKENLEEHQFCIKNQFITDHITNIGNVGLQLLHNEMIRGTTTLQVIQEYFTNILQVSISTTKIVLDNPEQILSESETIARNCFDRVNQLYDVYLADIVTISENFNNIFSNQQKGLTVSKGGKKSPNKKKSTKKKSDKISVRSSTSNQSCQSYSKIDIQNFMLKAQTCVNEELSRLKIRLTLIRDRIMEDIQKLIDGNDRLFEEALKNINEQYKNDKNAINDIISVFQNAIEEEKLICEKIIFINRKYFLLTNILVHPFPIPLTVHSTPKPFFTSSQLQELVQTMMRTSPNGYIPKQSFLCFLAETLKRSKFKEFPEIPKVLISTDVGIALKKYLGSRPLIDWRDFVIHQLDIQFPDLETLWKINDNDLKIEKLFEDWKSLILLQMFPIKEQLSLLISLCKNDNPDIGFIKALSLISGNQLSEDWNEYFNYENFILIKEKIMKETVAEILDELVIKSIPSDQKSESNANIIATKSSVMRPRESATPQMLKIRQDSEIKKYLERRRLFDCGCEIPEDELESLTIDEKFEDNSFWIDEKSVVELMSLAFPWSNSLVGEGSNLKQNIHDIFKDLRNRNSSNGSVLCHQVIQSSIINEWIHQTLKFKRISWPEIMTEIKN